MEKYIVGKDYRYSDLEEFEDKEGFEFNDYGEELLGKNAIHIRDEKTLIDVWFIFKGMANEGILKCVYNN